jgi:hypothetical protein
VQHQQGRLLQHRQVFDGVAHDGQDQFRLHRQRVLSMPLASCSARSSTSLAISWSACCTAVPKLSASARSSASTASVRCWPACMASA